MTVADITPYLLYATVALTVSRLTWLMGLAVVLRGSEPRDRPAILRAFRGRHLDQLVDPGRHGT